MGLTVYAKHLACEDSYDCGYITFAQFRAELAKTYNEDFGLLYKKWLWGEITETEIKYMNELCNDDLDIFLTHSDCDGKLTPKECRKIYDAIKNYKMDMQGHNYGIMKPYNMLEQWKGIFNHCYKKRVNLYFS
jgi:hypothetical protein